MNNMNFFQDYKKMGPLLVELSKYDEVEDYHEDNFRLRMEVFYSLFSKKECSYVSGKYFVCVGRVTFWAFETTNLKFSGNKNNDRELLSNLAELNDKIRRLLY